MSGYVASARIVRAAPRLARPGRSVDAAGWATPDDPAEGVVVDGDPGETVAARGVTLAARQEAIRERWAQLTFFLFDSNSWR